jgi:hypothetical protein
MLHHDTTMTHHDVTMTQNNTIMTHHDLTMMHHDLTMMPLTKILKSRTGQDSGSDHNLRPVMSSPQIIITRSAEEEDEPEKAENDFKENDGLNDDLDFSCKVSVVVEKNDSSTNDVPTSKVKIELPKFQLQVRKQCLVVQIDFLLLKYQKLLFFRKLNLKKNHKL